MDDIDSIAAALRGRLFGTTRVVDAHASRGADVDGEPSVYIQVQLSEPADGWDTRPVDDILALHRAVRTITAQHDPKMSVFAHYRPRVEG